MEEICEKEEEWNGGCAAQETHFKLYDGFSYRHMGKPRATHTISVQAMQGTLRVLVIIKSSAAEVSLSQGEGHHPSSTVPTDNTHNITEMIDISHRKMRRTLVIGRQGKREGVKGREGGGMKLPCCGGGARRLHEDTCLETARKGHTDP
ncbi:hypothetical protein DPX16_12698 [Anabarilius grahami]|uniref:Uncharacterized protein n=1 Tax=Anabarilius grahami TaxID=495550 RepID=A0A3N0XTT7_ANAGA|nr:hypothetical protein DPX16_12698 [Anabarilius grahami]